MAQLILEEGAAPSTPATGKVAIYAKTDSKFYTKDDAGTESLLGATTALVTGDSAVSQGDIINGGLTASVAASAMTISLKTQAGTDPSASDPIKITFRSSTLGSGTWNVRSVTGALSVVVSSGSTLGTANGVQSRLAVIAIDNAGTVELAVVNMAGGVNLDETTLISTTAEGGAGAADSASTIYSTTARTSVPFRVVGFVESTQATAGTWATAPSTIQGAGGQSLSSHNSFGFGQAWTDVKASRAAATVYYNMTSKPIAVTCEVTTAGSGCEVGLKISGLAVQYFRSAQLGEATVFGIVLPNNSYEVLVVVGTLNRWNELR